mgnify:CR=1 FL=1
MQNKVLGWVRRRTGTGVGTETHGGPRVERLEVRLLLSADVVGAQEVGPFDVLDNQQGVLAQPEIAVLAASQDQGLLGEIRGFGADPLLSVSSDATAERGSTITIDILVDDATGLLAADRSEERRVGKECSSGGSPYA